jgi:hypothetical protein
VSERPNIRNSDTNGKWKIETIALLLTAVICYCLSILIPICLVLITGARLDREVDPEVVNGIITGSAIFFAFSTLYGEKRKSFQVFPFVIFFVQVLLLVVTCVVYFAGYLTLQYAPLSALLSAMISLLNNLSSWLLIHVLNLVLDQ